MQSDVLVSVVVPTYNHEKYIEECLDGIVAQETSFSFEIVVGDDCSTDSNRDKIKLISDRYPGKFKLLFHDKNLGPAKHPGKNNSIECFRASAGKYIAFCEGDDYWTDKHKLQKQVDFLEKNPDYNICFHQTTVITENPGYDAERPEKILADTFTAEDLLRLGNIMFTVSCVLRNPFITDFPEWFYHMRAGDYAFYLLALKHKKIKFLPEDMAVYRIHGSGVWGRKSRITNYQHEIESFRILYGAFPEYQDNIKTAIYNRYLFIADYYRLNGEAAETFRYELKIFWFCITYRHRPSRSHLGLAAAVVRDYLGHKLKLN
jgi:glycosyltransferase involved in cell wall biosynthesis